MEMRKCGFTALGYGEWERKDLRRWDFENERERRDERWKETKE
jgi:hypothetical protein